MPSRRIGRQLRGRLLRIGRRRGVALMVGLLICLPSIALMLFEFEWETWYTQGFSLIAGATGAALIAAAWMGERPDWIE